jgi:ribonuclease E
VPLPSGGSIVVDHTEALVAVDVNSARATKGSDIEETALRTNCEAADEVARQLRLRDLGGLIVIDFIDMEDAKNQRQVENRLKDALHYDRARVQMGKISRFGLVELSRQRLRPALNEGSHVTCPRCNGVGVIRDTESSALHILRILQEEAMKEGTAAVHAQVPVEVATFLLNEKRADIAKLEARLRVSVVLIPNKFIDTPHYHIERLKHDDPRLDDVKASFERAAELAPSTDTPYAAGKPIDEQIRARQEAVVKGIVPETPAPMAAPAAPTAPAPLAQSTRLGWWDKVVAFFSGEPAAAVSATSKAVQPALPARSEERRGDRRRGRGERDGRRDGRRDDKRRDEKRDVKRDDKRDDKRDAVRDERKGAAKPERRDGRRGERAPMQPKAGEAVDSQRPRGERRPERPVEPQAQSPAEPAGTQLPPELLAEEPIIATTAGATLVTADATTADAGSDERRRRRRRRRGRGARDSEDTTLASGDNGGSSEASPLADERAVTQTPPAQTSAEKVSPSPAAVSGNGHDSAPPDRHRTPSPAPVAPPPAPVAASGVVVMRTPDLVTIPATVALPAAHPAPLPLDDLQPVLELAGLTLVQTEPAKLQAVLAEVATEAPPRRSPRERPRLPPIEEAPLVQVETRRSDSA